MRRSKVYHAATVDLRFFQREAPTRKGVGANILFGQICRKLHENEENWTGGVKILQVQPLCGFLAGWMELRYYFRICIVT